MTKYFTVIDGNVTEVGNTIDFLKENGVEWVKHLI